MRQVKPIPPNMGLGETLAQRVRQLREFRNMTLKDLARWSRFSLSRLEDIESGLEIWFSAPDRQMLSKALGVEPVLLEEVEAKVNRSHDEKSLEIACYDLAQFILRGDSNLKCPVCNGLLKCSIKDAFDLEGIPIRLPKAFCTCCPFVI
jgi:transcriptional regulator with XRE-family HTH domain